MEEIKDSEIKEEKAMAILKRYLREFYSPFLNLPHYTVFFFKNFSPLTKYYGAQTKIWLLTPVPRWRTIVATVSFMSIMTVALIYGGEQIFAATYTFNQTDWSGGQDASNITHPTNQTGWTKYSAQTGANTTGTPGSVKISSLVGQFTEGFTSTTYEDTGATTALWDTSANLLSNPTIISGTLYGTNETTPITGAAKTVKMKNGSNTVMSTESNSGDGTFSFSIPYNQLPVAGDIITIWIDGETEDGTLVFRYGSSCTGNTDCTGLAVYQNEVIFSSYDGSPLTHTNLSACDNDSGTGCTDTEIGFTSNAGTLALSAGRTFRIKDSSASFTQGGTITAPTFKQSAGTFTGATQAITISGDFTLSGGAFTSTTNTLTVNGNWTSNTGSPTFNATTGMVNFSVLVYTAAKTLTPGSVLFNNVTITNGGQWDSAMYHVISGTMSVEGNLTLTQGTCCSTSTSALLSGTIQVKGNVTVNSNFSNGGGLNGGGTLTTIELNGTGDQTITGSATGYLPSIKINKSTGAVILSGTIYVIGNWNWSSGPTLTAGSSTLIFYAPYSVPTATITGGSVAYNNVSFYHEGNYQQANNRTISGTLDVNGNLYLHEVTFNTTRINGGTITVAGNYTIDAASGTTFDGGTTAVTLDGTGAQTISVNGPGTVTNLSGTLTINKASGTATLGTNFTPGGAFNITQGTFDQGASYNLTAPGVTVGASGTWTNTGTGDITLSGNVTNAGTVTLNSNGGTCGDVKDIVITTSSIPTTRSWGAGGTYTFWDLDIRYMTGTHTAYRSTIGTSTTWTNDDVGACTTTAMLPSHSNLAQNTIVVPDLLKELARNIGSKLAVQNANLNKNSDEITIRETLPLDLGFVFIKDKIISFSNFKIKDKWIEFFSTERAEAAANVTAQSLNVSTGALYVYTATLTATANAGTGSITYYLSNDGGSNFFQVTSGVDYNFASNGNGDVRWKATLTGNATVSSIVLDYNYYGNVTLTSNAYDATDATNIVTKLAWVSSGVDSTNLVRLQIRTSTDGSSWSGWCGYADTSSCPGTNYFNASDMVSGSIDIPSSHVIRNGGDDRWFQYRVTLVPGTGATTTATLEDVTITYVVNAPPEFNPTNGLVVSQITDSADANFGKVKIDYSIRDPDTSTGTTNPGFVTPSFQYNIGAGLVSITSSNLSASATANKAVDGTSYTAYTAYWDAQTQIPTNYLTTAVIKVTINDNEGANNTASSTSSNFTLDTKVPAVSASTFDSTTDIITLTAADDTNLQYRISNNADLSADGLNATSGAWQSAGGNSISLTPAWIPTGSPSYENIYIQVRDTAGNLSSPNIVTPSTVGSANLQDISNVPINVYKEFLSWALYTPPASGGSFANYKVYRSTDGSSYSLISTITDVSSNSYFDSSVSANVTYYYKITVTDTGGDVGNYSTAVSDKVDGQGGTDLIAPTITAVTVSESQATYVTVTWTTDELANSVVEYSISPSTAFGTTASVASFVTAHSVTITNLTPGTTYLFRVKSTDVIGNLATSDNSGAGYSFVAGGGPVISNVGETSVSEHLATITWNTNTDSDSYVSYSTNANVSSPTRVGSASLVGGSTPFQHTVNLTGLTAGTRYYYFVESTDASSNYSKDTNSNNYYSFTTTNDNKGPVISGMSAPVLGRTAAIVVWQTDEPATSQVQYGKNSGSYSVNTTLDSTLTIFHIGALSGLSDGDTYYYRVRSSDESGNETISSESSFVTGTSTVVVTGGSGSSNSATDTSPPVISNIRVKDIKPFSATISFDTDEETIGFVDYGLDPVSLLGTSANSSHFRNSEVELRGLLPGKTYTFLIKAVDRSGNVTVSEKDIFTTTTFSATDLQVKDAEAFQKELEEAIESALPSLVPPFVGKPVVSDLTDTSAKVTWKTNIKSYSVLAYAEDSAYDATAENPYPSESSDTVNKVTEHEILLSNLKPDTLYHIMARSFSLPEVVGRSNDLTFLTEAPKIQANIGSVTNDSFKATWATSEPTTSVVEYRNLKTGELNQKSSDTKTRAHDILVDGLTPGTAYNVNVFGYNEKGNKVSIASSVRITTSIDTIPPVITSLTIDSALIAGRTDKTQTIVSWRTNEPSTSIVFYKEGSALPDEKLTNKVEQTNNLVIDHAVVVSTLKPGGLYSIQVASTDAAGNLALFPIRTAVVPQQGQSVIEIIFKNFEDTFEFLK